MKIVSATILSCAMFAASASGAFANVNASPLAAGKPAGVHKAQLLEGDNGIFVLAGAALVGITVGLATAGSGPSATGTGGSGGSTSTSTSTSTGTSP